MGWLHASPKHKDQKTDLEPRVKNLPNGSIYLKMPELQSYSYIVDIWHEVGLSKVGGMQSTSIDWQDLAAYSNFNPLDKWEALQVISMSKSYVNSMTSSKDPMCPAPYCSDPELARQQQRQALKERRLLKLKQAKAAD